APCHPQPPANEPEGRTVPQPRRHPTMPGRERGNVDVAVEDHGGRHGGTEARRHEGTKRKARSISTRFPSSKRADLSACPFPRCNFVGPNYRVPVSVEAWVSAEATGASGSLRIMSSFSFAGSLPMAALLAS